MNIQVGNFCEYNGIVYRIEKVNLGRVLCVARKSGEETTFCHEFLALHGKYVDPLHILATADIGETQQD